MGKSSRLTIAVSGARLFCLSVLGLLLSLPCDSSVGAVTFAFRGFEEDSLHLVSNSSWIFDNTTGCFKFYPTENLDLYFSASGRFLFPGEVQMIDPGSTTIKSFSTSFIYQLQILPDSFGTGPGMAFIIVPDNVTLGAPVAMGLITEETSATAKNYVSDNHTLGVELDTYMNPEFNDTNNNHIGINLASMISTYAFKPVYILASSSAILYQQIWIDYFEVDSRMDIYYADYKQGKPAKPQGSKSGLDLSLLKKKMFTGFSTAKGLESSNVPYVCAWSFSNDGVPAPSIVIAQDATPGAPPPPAPVTPPPPAPVTPSPPPYGPVAAPSLPPPASIPSPPPVPTRSPAPGISSPPPPAYGPPQVPPLPSPSPISPSPNGSATPPSASPPPFTFSPPPFSTTPFIPPPSSPLIAPSPGPGHEPPPTNVAAAVGAPVGVFVFICLLSLCWCKVWRRPLRIFISHTGGPNGAGKNFPSWLHQAMVSHRRWSSSKFRVKPFLDVENCPMGLSFPKKIFKELARFDVGVVVVTPDFFEKRWPMTELIKFVEVQRNDREGRIRVLPLFYELTTDELRLRLNQGTWEQYWRELSAGNHPLQLQECTDAVSWLCQQRGIPYVSEKRGYDKVYIDTILAAVDKILCDERSIAADLRWAMTLFKRN